MKFYGEASIGNMSSENFVEYLMGLDVRLWRDGEGLRCNAPDGALTSFLRTELTRRKTEILELLDAKGDATVDRPAKVEPATRGDRLPLSNSQKRLWLLSERQGNTGMYHMALAYRLKGLIDLSAVEKSLGEIQRRHEILRTTYVASGSEPRAVIAETNCVSLEYANLGNIPGDRREAEVVEYVIRRLRQSFDLSSGPLWRTDLLRVGDNDHLLLFTMHHIAFDGWSKNILREEFESFYNAFSSGKPPGMSPLPIQYADYAQWQLQWLGSEAAREQLSYWRQRLEGGVSELKLPARRSRPDIQTYRGANQSFTLPHGLAASLHQFSRQERVSLLVTLLTAYNILLHQYSEQEDLILCLPSHGRNRVEFEKLIGCFNNVVVIRIDLAGNPTFREVVARVREAVLGAYKHQDVPIQTVSEFPGLVRTPLTRAMFSMKNSSGHRLTLSGVEAESVTVRKPTADFDLAMYMEKGPQNLGGIIEFNTDLFDDSIISPLVQNFQSTLETMVLHPGKRLAQLPRFGKRSADVKLLLRQLPQVDDAVVIPQFDKGQFRRLVAYIVPNQYDIPNPDHLRHYVKKYMPDHLVPAAFIAMDGFPLDEKGEIDRSALPPLTSNTGYAASNHVEPRTPLERELVKIWTRVLWLEQDIGIRDNFFDLGGHSLLSVQLFSAIEEFLGRKLPPNMLSELGTVEDLAHALDNEDRQRWPGATTERDAQCGQGSADLLERSGLSLDIYRSLLAHTSGWKGKGQRVSPDSLIIGVNTKGTKQAMFWCCQGFRELTQLARYIGADQPIYGMRSGHRIMELTEENENALAAYYTGEILGVQPEGPFLIGGNCQAARIAFKIAKQLIENGRYITLLCLQERFIPEFYPGRVAFFYGNDSNRNPFHYFTKPQLTWKQFYQGRFSVQIIPGNHGEFFKEPNIQILAEKIGEEIDCAKKESDVPSTIKIEGSLRLLPESACQAILRTISSITVAPGQQVPIRVEVYNDSNLTWPGGPGSSVTLGQRWLDDTGRHVLLIEPGGALPANLKPGESTKVDVSLGAPLKKGPYTVELDMLDSGARWFGECGSTVTKVAVVVRWRSRQLNWFWDRLRYTKRLLMPT